MNTETQPTVEEKAKITSQTYRNIGRDKYAESGLSYSDFHYTRIDRLVEIIKEELAKDSVHMPMLIEKPAKSHFKYNNEGYIVSGYLKVRGSYFRNREAISFNRNGFIGFAGWADTYNVQPFVKAFDRWIDWIKLNP